jgi:hypothetical protein
MLTGTGSGDPGYGPLAFSNLSGTGAGSQSVGAFGVTLSEGGYSLPYSQATRPFDVSFRIIDSAAGQSGLVIFHGYLEGGIGPTEEMGYTFEQAARVAGKYLNPTPPAFRLGNNLYQVSISPFYVHYDHDWGSILTPFGNGDYSRSTFDTTSYARLSDQSMVSVQVTSVTPEPSALVLATSAIAVMGSRLWRRRQRGRE